MAYKVLIAGGKESCGEVASLLGGSGYDEVRQAAGASAALEAARAYQPDVIIMDVELPDGDAVSLAGEILNERPVPIIVFGSYSQIDKVKEAEASGVSSYIFRPLSRENLMGVIELGASRFRQCQALHTELGSCKEALRVRKLVEKAKGILMKRSALSEEDAFLKIQKLSRNNNISMEKVAQSIITASELL